MANIVGTKEAKEISIVRQGANQHSHVIMAKNFTPSPAPNTSPETDEMDVKTMKAIAAMDEVTKTYFVGLDDETAAAFAAKSADDQKAEAHAAKKVVDDAAAAKAASEEAAKAAETDTKKALELANQEIETLKKQNAARDREDELKKTAAGEDFKGYPGGTEAVVAALKSFDGLPEAARKSAVDGMKAHAALAAKVAGTEFGGRTEDDIAKANPKSAALNKKLGEIVEAKGCTHAEAMAELRATAVGKKLISEALNEEGALV